MSNEPTTGAVSYEIPEDELWKLSHIAAAALSSEVWYRPGDELGMAHQRLKNLENALERIQNMLHNKLGVKKQND